ncbi:UNVERIFIED_CONTAM: hypothetical protein PYX00_001746 [Menopon gallinae]|uniref:Uncharacterized protein n=1 Tax=Menopon gallinae TaxID=328185 RepID=A0AAW2IF91_9NEOP
MMMGIPTVTRCIQWSNQTSHWKGFHTCASEPTETDLSRVSAGASSAGSATAASSKSAIRRLQNSSRDRGRLQEVFRSTGKIQQQGQLRRLREDRRGTERGSSAVCGSIGRAAAASRKSGKSGRKGLRKPEEQRQVQKREKGSAGAYRSFWKSAAAPFHQNYLNSACNNIINILNNFQFI